MREVLEPNMPTLAAKVLLVNRIAKLTSFKAAAWQSIHGRKSELLSIRQSMIDGVRLGLNQRFPAARSAISFQKNPPPEKNMNQK